MELVFSCAFWLLQVIWLVGKKRRKKKTTPFGFNLLRRQVLYQAAQRVILVYFSPMANGIVSIAEF